MSSPKRARLQDDTRRNASVTEIAAAGEDTQALQLATFAGDVEALKRLLSEKVEANSENWRSGKLLHIAAEKGHADVVSVLLDHGANLNQASVFFNNSTSAHLAALEGHVEVLSTLLRRGAFVDAKNKSGRTPLHLTTNHNKPESAKLLLDFKADVNAKDVYRFSPLHLAARNGCVEIVRTLLIMGADVKAADKRAQATPLHLAAANGHVEVVKVFWNQKACTDVDDVKHKTPLHYAIANNKIETAELLLSYQNLDLSDPLVRERWSLFANNHLRRKSWHGNVKAIKWLLSKGADVNAANAQNNQPLHLAVMHMHPRAAKVLLSAGAPVNAAGLSAKTPLHLAASKYSAPLVKLLLSAGASVDAADFEALRPLHYSAAFGSTEVMEVLLRSGATVNSSSVTGNTPLHVASELLFAEKVKLLLSAGAHVDAANDWAFTPLHYAAAYGRAAVAKSLLSAGAPLNAASATGTTPLHLAAARGHTAVVRLLLSAGADVNTASAFHVTPLHSATRRCKDVFQKHVVKMMALNAFVSESNMLSVVADDKMTSFQRSCEEEIELMKSNGIADGVSFYDLLTKGPRQLEVYAANKDIAQAFKSNVYSSVFPIYAAKIKSRFLPAIQRAELLEAGRTFFDSFLTGLPRLAFLCTEDVLMYLSISDLQLLKYVVKAKKR